MSIVEGIRIAGISTAVPRTVSRTEDYTILTPEERSRFAKATGVFERRIVTGSQCASDLAAFAADDVLNALDWAKRSVGVIVLITQTSDYPVPATSVILQHKLRLPQNCIAFDVNLGCSAFPFGLAIVSSLMRSLTIHRALLLIGDVSSRVCSYNDKSSWPLFGDAGSATALELNSNAEPMAFDLMSDGSGKDAIIIKTGGLASRNPLTRDSLDQQIAADGIKRNSTNLILKGPDIFSFAISQVPPSIGRALSLAGWSTETPDFFVLHQANKMINETIRKKVGYSSAQTLSSLERFGNTSSVSIPVTICVSREQFTTARRIVASGFGVGLSWGSVTATLATPMHLGWLETDDVYITA